MESIIQNPTLAFVAVIITGILASLPGLYAAWIQRKRIRAEGMKEEADAAEIITRAYARLQASYAAMIESIEENYRDCSEKMELLAIEVDELRKENKQLIKDNAGLRKQIRTLETHIADLTEEVTKE